LPTNLPQRIGGRPATSVPMRRAMWKSAHTPLLRSNIAPQHEFVSIKTRSNKIFSRFAFDCFAWDALRFSRAVDVL